MMLFLPLCKQKNVRPKPNLTIMKLQQQLEALDARVIAGDILGAFDEFFADNCITHSNPQDMTRSKGQKAEALRWFFSNIASINNIERLATVVDGTETRSQFVFDFTNHQGQPMVFREVIRRVWKDGKVVEEQYLVNDTLTAQPEKPAKKAVAAKKSTSDAEKPAKAAAAKTAAPKAPAKKAAAPATQKAAKADDLTLIEGIGPKIAELLVKAGIVSFADLAAAKPAAIQTILDAAGKKFQIHDPATWPKQAALARDGKTAELAKLQAELKGGK